MADSKLRIGLVGAGTIMRIAHAPTLATSADAELAAVFDLEITRANAITKTFGGHAYDDLGRMLEQADLNAVVVATPNCFHEENVVAAAAHGLHVLCEKPLAINVASAAQMIKACDDAGVVLQTGFNQRFWTQNRIAREIICSGLIGQIHQMRSLYSEKSTAYPAATEFRYDLAQSGGATIIDLTVHRIDIARYLVGEIVSVFAELDHSFLPEKVDDNVWLLTKFDNGARGCLTSNRISPNIGDGTDIFGTEGTIHIATESINPHNSAPLRVYTEKPKSQLPDILQQACYPDAWWKEFDGGWITVKPPRSNPYQLQLQEFCASIREGRPSNVSGTDGLRAQEVVQAGYLSHQSGTWVDLPLPEDAPFNVPAYS